MLHNMVAPLAPMQLSSATDRPGVETGPRGWHTVLSPPVPNKPQALAAPALSILASSIPKDRETSLALAFIFPCWVTGGGHNTNTALANSRLYTAGQEGIQESGQGRGKVQHRPPPS